MSLEPNERRLSVNIGVFIMSVYQDPWRKVQKIRKKIGGKFQNQKQKLKKKNKEYQKKMKDLFDKNEK